MKIFELLQEGKGPAAISKLLGCSKPTIQKIQHAIAVGGTPADKKPGVAKEEPGAGSKQPHINPEVSNPVDVAKTISQYKSQAAVEFETEEEAPEGEGSETGEEEPSEGGGKKQATGSR